MIHNGKNNSFFDLFERIALIIFIVVLTISAVILHLRTSIEGNKQRNVALYKMWNLLREEHRININTASINELILLPGIGREFAFRIIEHRRFKGNFQSGNDLLKVKGIGRKKLEKIEGYIRFK